MISGLALPPIPSPGYAYALNHVHYAYQISVVVCSYCWPTFTSGCLQHCKDAKQPNIRCIASSLKFLWCRSMECNMEEKFSMEWNMEENFSMEWNMEWKIFGMEWKWNGRKLPVWNMEKLSFIPFHTMPCRQVICDKLHYCQFAFS